MIMKKKIIKKNNNKIICVICAKKVSKGLKNKNILKINNKELVIYSLEQAISTKIFDRIVVNTDSMYIIKILKKYSNVEIINRPKFLRGSFLSKLTIIKYSINKISKKYNEFYEYIVDLDVTSPLRNKKDILNSINLIKKQKSLNLISVTKSKKNPYFNMVEKSKNGRITLVKKPKKAVNARQKAPKVYDMNASISIFNFNFFKKNINIVNKGTIIYEMKNCFDIDSEFDFITIKNIIESKK